ncbi:AAA family ATPase [Streptomyces sp. P1-3]|uniref:nSTAND1 domain-containing NTPase n=1 Tax=Streptomyces sp. P1-3 TaxID=3421658 RepID=UPI003D36E346
MDRRPLKLILDVLLMMVGALLGIATNYATSEADHVPLPLRLLREWSVPMVGVALLLLIGGQVWLHYLDRPVPVRRVWDSAQPPYPGLESFTEDDAAVFFGRDRETDALVARLHPAAPGRAQRFVAVVGPSGSGKSSLVRAGLLPALARRRGRWAVAEPLAPGVDPVRALERRLAHLPDTRPALLVVDQLEELFTLSGPEERGAFLAAVRDSLRADPRLWVVATLRSDFLTEFLESGFAELVREPTLVGALGREELHQVIEKPAEHAGMAFAPGVVARMVDECGGGDALPLLAYTLQELYLRAGGSGGTVTEETYRALGGVAGALSDRADRIAAELAGAPVIPALLHFVTVDRAEPTRRRVRRADLTSQEREVVDAFVAGRLLTSDDGVLDVTHEALFRQWAPLRQAVVARVEELRRRTELERWAQDWEHAGRLDAYLLAGERLTVARQWMAESARTLGAAPLVAEFVDRSARADRATMTRTADAVALRVFERAEREPELAVHAALAAVEECGATPTAVQALQAALSASRLRTVLRGFEGPVTGAAWSPDGRRLAASSDDGTVRVWHPGHDDEPVVLRGGGARMNGVAWSPDGTRLAAASRDSTVRIWSTVTWAESAVLHHAEATGGRTGGVGGVAWSPDGTRLASVGGDRALRIWDAGTYAEVAAGRGHEGMVWSVTWSPDGTLVAGAGEDGTVRVWDAGTGAAVRELTGHRSNVESVRWSPDGHRIASASGDRTVLIWDTGTWTGERRLETTDVINSLAWSPDGRRLAGADAARTAHVWSLHGTAGEIRLTGHTDTVYGIAWSPDGERVATAARDRVLAVWDVSERPNVLVGHEDSVWRAAWSPDGTRIASASQDGTVRIWDADTGRPTALLRGGEVSDTAWSPDGTRVVAALRDGRAVVWRADGIGEGVTLTGHTDQLSDVSWSPDGTRIATASRDNTARIWDAATGAELHVLARGTAVRGHDDWLSGTAWSPDGRYVATSATDRRIIIWDAADGATATTLLGHHDHVWKIDWSPDGRRLATGSRDRTIRVWDPFGGTDPTVMTGHEDWVQDVAWSPDGTRVASVSRDRTVRLWDPETATQIAVLGIHTDWANGVSWHPDGTRLTTASRDRTVRIWTLADPDTDALLRRARSRAFRDLSGEERRAFLLPEER